MTVSKTIIASDNYNNQIYFLFENGGWRAINKCNMCLSLSYFSSNPAELYIALSNCTEVSDAIEVIKDHADYLRADSVREFPMKRSK